MTVLAITPDWSVLDDEGVRRAIDAAARIVSARYRSRSVAMLAERDDLAQEARILVATRPALHGVEENLLRFRLVRDLTDLVKWRAQDARNTLSLDAMNEGNA